MSRLGVIAAPLPLATCLLVSLALTSCGGGDDAQLLPGATAREITANLDTVEQLADEGECLGAEGAAAEVSAQVEALQGVEPELKRALERGATRLNEVVDTCEDAVAEAPPVTEPETTEADDEDDEKERKEREKELEKEEKEAEREEEEEAKDDEKENGPPDEVPPQQPNGPGEGPGDDGSEDGPSGGIGPGAAVGGDD